MSLLMSVLLYAFFMRKGLHNGNLVDIDDRNQLRLFFTASSVCMVTSLMGTIDY